MKRVYNIELSKADIRDLQKGLREYREWVKKKTAELSRRLAEIGVERAELYFSQALYDGVNDVTVSKVSKGKNTWVVRANGATVLFIEFGTGVHYPNAPLDEYLNAEGMVHGSYGRGLGNNDYWFYTGQPGNAGGELAHGHRNTTITHGNPANMSMYNAVKDLEFALDQIVREVFST